MIRIIFGNGDIVECEHIEKIYMEETEMDKVTIVGNINLAREEKNVRTDD